MTKGRLALPFGGMVVMTASQTSFIALSPCHGQVRLILMTRREGFATNPLKPKEGLNGAPQNFLAGVGAASMIRDTYISHNQLASAQAVEAMVPVLRKGLENSVNAVRSAPWMKAFDLLE
jgi:hypothetical protein